MKALVIALLLCPFLNAHGQNIRHEEKRLLELINDLRANPQAFLQKTARPYLIDNAIDSVQNRYAASLLMELKKQKPLPSLHKNMILTNRAQAFAVDMGKTGSVGHYSKRLGDMSQRLVLVRSDIKGENCDYGHSDALDILMSLLIDEGVPSLGHRKNLLDPRFTRIGVAIEPHRKYTWNCVMDFAE